MGQGEMDGESEMAKEKLLGVSGGGGGHLFMTGWTTQWSESGNESLTSPSAGGNQ